MIKKISLLGCTGSVGRQVVEVVKRYPDRFRIVALAANEGDACFLNRQRNSRPNLRPSVQTEGKIFRCPQLRGLKGANRPLKRRAPIRLRTLFSWL